MRETGLRHITLLTLWLAILVVIGACSHTPQSTIDAMDRAESLMEIHPDSALAILGTISPESLRSKADKARCSLLTTMAVDKTTYQITDFKLLQPALDYYLQYGNADQKLKTLYYEGRYHMDQGEDGKALNSFLKAYELRNQCTDSFAIARLEIAQGYMYRQEYQYDKYLSLNLRAAEIYKSIKDSGNYIRSLARALEGATLTSDKKVADKILPECIDGILKYADQKDYIFMVIASFPQFRPKEDFIKFINRFDNDSILSLSNLYIANALYEYGDLDSALDYFRKAVPTDSIYYLTTKIQLQEEAGNLREAIETYDEYLETREHEVNKKLENNLLFARKQFEIELEADKKISRRNKLIYTVSSAAVILLMICLIIYLLLRNQRLRRRMVEVENNQLKIKLQRLNNEINEEREQLRKLLAENKSISGRLKFIINNRINILNGIIAKDITTNCKFAASYDELINKFKSDKDLFIKDILKQYEITHPHFIDFMEEKGLTAYEQGFLCLYAMGLRGKEVGLCLGKSSHKNDASAVRTKLGLDSNGPNLRDYVASLLQNEK